MLTGTLAWHRSNIISYQNPAPLTIVMHQKTAALAVRPPFGYVFLPPCNTKGGMSLNVGAHLTNLWHLNHKGQPASIAIDIFILHKLLSQRCF